MSKKTFILLFFATFAGYLNASEIDVSQTNANFDQAFGRTNGSIEILAQSFVPSQVIFSGVVFWKRPNGDAAMDDLSGTIAIKIKNDDSGVPGEQTLAEYFYPVSVWTNLENKVYTNVNVTCHVRPGTKYWIVFEKTPLSKFSYPQIRANNSTNTYPAGEAKYYTKAAGWVKWNYAIYFKTLWDPLPSGTIITIAGGQ